MVGATMALTDQISPSFRLMAHLEGGVTVTMSEQFLPANVTTVYVQK